MLAGYSAIARASVGLEVDAYTLRQPGVVAAAERIRVFTRL